MKFKLSDYTTRHVVKNGIPFEIRVGTCDENVLDEVITGDCYQLEHINLRETPNIIDVGGHIGAFTKYCAWRWPRAKLHVFEANPNNWELIESNLGCIANKTTLYKGALVGKIPRNKKLVINPAEAKTITGGWGILFGEGEVKASETCATIDIESFYNISSFLKKMNILDILKLDCEGSEFSILKEMTDAELYKVNYLLCEIHCGALPHHNWTYKKFRERILDQFVCPELEARRVVNNSDLFNIVACNRKLRADKARSRIL
jgi:FkbM family methyltransferase